MIALASRRQIVAKTPNLLGASAAAALGFAVFFWISVTWFVFQAPDWMLSYTIPSNQLPMVGVHALFLLGLLLSSMSGHVLTAVFIQRGQTKLAVATLASGMVCWLGLWLLTLDRYMVVGTYDEFAAGAATPLVESTISGAMNFAGVAQGLVGFGLVGACYTHGKRLRAR